MNYLRPRALRAVSVLLTAIGFAYTVFEHLPPIIAPGPIGRHLIALFGVPLGLLVCLSICLEIADRWETVLFIRDHSEEDDELFSGHDRV